MEARWKLWCNDSKHFVVSQVYNPFNENDCYQNIGWYNVVCQVIKDDKEHCISLFVDLPSRVNDSRIPKKFAFYYQA